MPISLRPEHEKLIKEAIKSGAYEDANDVVGQALDMLFSQDQWLRNHKQDISEKIDRAFAQFERGEFLSADRARAEMEKRKKAWLNER